MSNDCNACLLWPSKRTRRFNLLQLPISRTSSRIHGGDLGHHHRHIIRNYQILPIAYRISWYGGFLKSGYPPKLSILVWFSIVNHLFWGTLISGNLHIEGKWRKHRPRLRLARPNGYLFPVEASSFGSEKIPVLPRNLWDLIPREGDAGVC